MRYLSALYLSLLIVSPTTWAFELSYEKVDPPFSGESLPVVGLQSSLTYNANNFSDSQLYEGNETLPKVPPVFYGIPSPAISWNSASMFEKYGIDSSQIGVGTGIFIHEFDDRTPASSLSDAAQYDVITTLSGGFDTRAIAKLIKDMTDNQGKNTNVKIVVQPSIPPLKLVK